MVATFGARFGVGILHRHFALVIGVSLAACAGGPSSEPSRTADAPEPDLNDTIHAATPTNTPESTNAATESPTAIPKSALAFESRVVTLVDELDAATGGVTIDSAGNLYVADIGNIPSRNGRVVYRISPDGVVSTFAEGDALHGPSGNAIDSKGNLYQANFSGGEIVKISPEGEVSTVIQQGLRGPIGIAIDAIDNLYVADCSGQSIRLVSPDGGSSLIATGSPLNCPNGITIDGQGHLYIANFGDGWVLKVTADGRVERLAELPGRNNGHLVYHDDLLYVVARSAHSIYTVTLDGEIALLAGTGERGWDDGPALEATFSLPNGIAISADGKMLFINQARQSIGRSNHPTTVRTIVLGDS